MLHLNFVDKGMIPLAYPLGTMSYQQFCAIPFVAQRIYTDAIDSTDTWILRDSMKLGGCDAILAMLSMENASHSPAEKVIIAASFMEARDLVIKTYNKVAAARLIVPVSLAVPIESAVASHPVPAETPAVAVEQVTPIITLPIESTSAVASHHVPAVAVEPVIPPVIPVTVPIESVIPLATPVITLPIVSAIPPVSIEQEQQQAKPPDDDNDIPPMIPKPSRKTNKNREVVHLRTIQYARDENFKKHPKGDWKCNVPGCPYHQSVKYVIKHLLKKHNIVASDLKAYLDRPL